MTFRLSLLLVALSAMLLAGCGAMGSSNTKSVFETTEAISDSDFAGTWHVIANIPYALERNKVAARVEYNRRPDGRYQDLYIARKGSFDAPEKTIESVTWSLDAPSNSHWRTRYFGPLRFDWAVLDYDADKGVMVSGGTSRNLAWVFARTPDIDDATYTAALDVLERNGFDRARVMRVLQQPSDLGRPGFAAIQD